MIICHGGHTTQKKNDREMRGDKSCVHLHFDERVRSKEARVVGRDTEDTEQHLTGWKAGGTYLQEHNFSERSLK